MIGAHHRIHGLVCYLNSHFRKKEENDFRCEFCAFPKVFYEERKVKWEVSRVMTTVLIKARKKWRVVTSGLQLYLSAFGPSQCLPNSSLDVSIHGMDKKTFTMDLRILALNVIQMPPRSCQMNIIGQDLMNNQ